MSNHKRFVSRRFRETQKKNTFESSASASILLSMRVVSSALWSRWSKCRSKGSWCLPSLRICSATSTKSAR